ncbi:MAG: glycerol-3-phosphate acyltransferase, partial [Blastochloris sp.]|nr:glycerol-3-phosphate acyltransferase [Blastochloris sp.]
IPTAYLINRLKGINIFEVGSGNMGAANTIRALGFWWGILVMLLDMLKGVGAIIVGRALVPENPSLAGVVAAIVVLIGHNWSLFAALITGKIRGGKGAATLLGTLIAIAPPYLTAAIALIGALLIWATRYISLAVLVAVAVMFVWMLVLIMQNVLTPEYLVYTLTVTILVFVRFRGNIQRLLAGTERRLGEPA